MRPYIIRAERADCVDCRRTRGKLYCLIEKPLIPYCQDCITKYVEEVISPEELTVPPKLITYAERYINFRLLIAQKRGIPMEEPLSFAENFYNPLINTLFPTKIRVPNAHQPFKAMVDNKEIKMGWHLAILNHIQTRRWLIARTEGSLVRDDIICPKCEKPMYYKGQSGTDDLGKYTVYRCLNRTDICKGSKKKKLHKYYGIHIPLTAYEGVQMK